MNRITQAAVFLLCGMVVVPAALRAREQTEPARRPAEAQLRTSPTSHLLENRKFHELSGVEGAQLEPLATKLDEGSLFSPLLVQLVTVGEDASRLPEFLLQAAELLERQTERGLQRLVVLAEPLMILFFGRLVGFVALALLQAIYGMNTDVLR